MADVPTGRPTQGAVVNDDPKSLYFDKEFDVAYIIKLRYLQMPALQSSESATLDTTDLWHYMVLLKFIEKASVLVGDYERAANVKALYESELSSKGHKAKVPEGGGLKFSWF